MPRYQVETYRPATTLGDHAMAVDGFVRLRREVEAPDALAAIAAHGAGFSGRSAWTVKDAAHFAHSQRNPRRGVSAALIGDDGAAFDPAAFLRPAPVITSAQAVEIAHAYASVQSWGDPSVTLYAFASTARVQSEEHRTAVLAQIDGDASRAAAFNDAAGDRDTLLGGSNADDVAALRAFIASAPVSAS